MPSAFQLSDPIRLLEALYDLEQPRDNWLRGVASAAGPVLDQGVGVGLVLYDVSGPSPRVEAMASHNVAPENIKVGADSHARPGWAAEIVECYRNVVCGTLDEHVPQLETRCALRESYAPLGIRDQVLVNGANRSGIGCALYVFSATHVRLSQAQRTLLSRLATHLSTAYRLQRRLERSACGDAQLAVDAVLSVGGQLKHAAPQASSRAARQCLADAVTQREWARSRGARTDSERATGAWKPLVVGRWSLVDCYERDGQRYITARENAPESAAQCGLSSRERQVASLAALGRSNKVIAYELGIVHSTVRVLLARAASKLGVHTRAELIERMRSLRPSANA